MFTANRSLNALKPEMKRRVEKLLKECKDRECPIFITETHRTQARQNYLYAFGRYGENKDKGKVTWTTKSNHTKGESIDFAFDHTDNIYKGQWDEVYDIAEEVGLKSLFRETGYDRPHLDYNLDWRPPFNRRKYEDDLIKWGIVSIPKDLDQPPTREESYKISMELFSRQHKQIVSLQKKVKSLEALIRNLKKNG